jgi:preprotein translocase subunit SecG
MYIVILILHILISFSLMAVVLMQSGKGRGLAGAFGGGGGNQTLFGGRGAVDFLGKATWFLGAAFMITSLTLALMAGASSGGSTNRGLIPKDTSTAPAIPGGTAPAPGEQAPSGGVQNPAPAGGETAPAPVTPQPSGGGR